MARWLWAAGFVIFGLLPACAAAAAGTPPATERAGLAPTVAQIALDGPIGPAAAEYFDNASKRAEADGAKWWAVRVRVGQLGVHINVWRENPAPLHFAQCRGPGHEARSP